MAIRLIATALVAACCAVAQGASPGVSAPGVSAPGVSGDSSRALRAELRRLGAAAQSLQQDLPGFTCRETAVSQVVKTNKRNPQKDKVKAQTRFVADLRAERGPDGRLHERIEVSTVNGRPFSGGRMRSPIMVEGGFDQSLDFFLPARQACFNFRLSKGRIDFDSPPGAFDRPLCKEMGAPSGFALLDAAGDATHIERRVPAPYAREVYVVDFASVEFTSTELGGGVYPLPAKMVADVPGEDSESLHFEAAYTGCRLFKATSTILPGAPPVGESEPSAAHP